MSAVVEQVLRCAGCKSLITDSVAPIAERQACPHCGAVARLAEVVIQASLTVRSTLMYKGKHGGRGKPFAWGKVGDDFFRRSGTWNRLARHFDRDQDAYDEVIIDPATNYVIREVHEPLSAHQGRGSAEQKRS
jgi:hypothetical protein